MGAVNIPGVQVGTTDGSLSPRPRASGMRHWWRVRAERVRDAVFVVAVALLLGACLVAGVVVYRSEAWLTREATFHRLDVQATLRAAALGARLDALVATAEDAARGLSGPVAAYLDAPDGSGLALANGLGRLRAFSGFDAVGLLAPDGTPLLPVAPVLPADLARDLVDRDSGEITPFFRLPGRALQFAVLVPVRVRDEGDPVAFLAAGVDAQSFIAPYLTPTNTHRLPLTVLLVTESGGLVRLLGADPPGGSVIERVVPADETLLSRLHPGHDGVLEGEGRDRDGPVRLAAAIPVPGTPWKIAAMIDRNHVLAALWVPALWGGGVALVLVAGVSLVWLYVLQRQRLRSAQADVARAAELERAEHLFRDTFEQAAIGLIHLGPDRSILRANRRVAEMMGYSQAQMIGLTLELTVHPEDIAVVEAARDRLDAGEAQATRVVVRAIRGDGRLIWVASTTTRAFEGSVPYYIVAAEDVTEQRATQEALRLSEERLRLALEGAHKGLWDFDAARDRFYLSPRWREIMGIGPDARCETRDAVEALFHPDDRVRARAALEAALESRSGFFDTSFRSSVRMARSSPSTPTPASCARPMAGPSVSSASSPTSPRACAMPGA